MYAAAAICLIVVLCGLALLHIYWALGGRLLFDGAIPMAGEQPVFVPSAGASLVAAFALLAAAALSGWRADLLGFDASPWASRVGVGLVSMAFGIRAVGDFRYVGFSKHVRGNVFARRDSLIYSPLCAAISVTAAALAMGSSDVLAP